MTANVRPGRDAILIFSIAFLLTWLFQVVVLNPLQDRENAAAALQRIAAEYREDLAQCSDKTDCQVETARRRLSEQELRTRIHALESVSK